MSKALGFFAGILSIAALLALPAQTQPEGPTVKVAGGEIRGELEDRQAVFKSIPFAAPPVGDLRWREPHPVIPWRGVRNGREFPPSCMQPIGGSEDCLTLNVWTPEWPSKAAKAVMVWFHGGGNTEGGTNGSIYYGASLAKHGVVVVTVQYRLGVFGFFAHPELTTESPHNASGNYALLDQIAALKWVHENIATFGGDPANVTIFGESAGAEDVGLLLISPLAKDLFHRAIAESGPLRKIYPSLAEQERQCETLAKALDAPPDNQIAYLRNLDADQVLATATANRQMCRPVNIDGYVLKEQPLKSYADGRQHHVPFMLGNNLREGFTPMSTAQLKEAIAAQYGDRAPRVLAAYGLDRAPPPAPDPRYGNVTIQYGTDQSNRCRVVLEGLQHQATGQPFYQFEFARDLPGRALDWSTHADELAFVFGNPALAEWGLTSAADNHLSDQMESYWTNFAKTGDPNGAGLPSWPKFEPAKRSYMSFNESGAAAGDGLRRAQCDLFLEAEHSRTP